VGEGRVEVFPGNYEDYLWRKQGGPALLSVPDVAQPSLAEETGANGGGKQKRINPLKLRKMQERCKEIEEEIATIETRIAAHEQSLLNFVSAEETARQTQSLEAHRAELASLMKEWEETSAVIEGR
jgi:ATP-binding cassette subfamily F protein 3